MYMNLAPFLLLITDLHDPITPNTSMHLLTCNFKALLLAVGFLLGPLVTIFLIFLFGLANHASSDRIFRHPQQEATLLCRHLWAQRPHLFHLRP